MKNTSTFTSASSDADGWAAIAKDLEGQFSDVAPAGADDACLGFIYVTAPLGNDLSSILTFLKQRTSIEDWVGTIGLGVCHGGVEYFDRPAAVAMIMTLPENTFGVVPGFADDVSEIPENVLGWMKNAMPPFGVVHGDPTNGRIVELIENLSLEIENLTLEVPGFLVGGLTASRGPASQIAVTLTDGGLSGVLFTPEIEVATGLTQGCAPVGAVHRVSESMDNIIMGLDDRPALEVFKEDIGELLSRDLSRVEGYIHAAFPIEGSDMGDYLVRNLMGIDTEHGWLAVDRLVHTGDQVLFVRRDPVSAEKDLRRMVESLLKRLPEPPRAGLYFSCVARGPNLFREEGHEAGIIADMLGDIPLVGFYGNGEISNNRLYGYTGVLTLFL